MGWGQVAGERGSGGASGAGRGDRSGERLGLGVSAALGCCEREDPGRKARAASCCGPASFACTEKLERLNRTRTVQVRTGIEMALNSIRFFLFKNLLSNVY